MKILIICQYYYPEQFLINQIAPELVKRGHQVTVLTGLPNYPSGIIPKEYRHGLHRHEILNGVEVIRCHEHERKKGTLNLILNYLSFRYFGIKTVRKLSGNYDVVFCYQLSPITMLEPAVIYKNMYGKPILNYCLDLWPESTLSYFSESSLTYKYISLYCKKLYKSCDRIAVTSKPFIEYFQKINGIERYKLCYLPQHADETMLNLDTKAKHSNITNFMFAGNIGKGQKIETIVKATELLKNRKDFIIHIVGDGSMRANIESMVLALGLADKFIFHGNQKREDMPRFYTMADALLITLRGNNAVGDTMPGKLQTYMTTGKPIFGAINGAANQIIKESQCGACAKAEDYNGLATIMADFIDNPTTYAACGENARKYFRENFTLKYFMDNLEKELYSLVK